MPKPPDIRHLTSSPMFPAGHTTLVYHGVPPDGVRGTLHAETFERHIRFLKRHFDILPPLELARQHAARRRRSVALTFDDGFRNNAEVVAPILCRHGVPALFFVSSRHSREGSHLWFSYLRALEAHYPGDSLCVRGHVMDMTRSRRHTAVAEFWEMLLDLKPHPAAMYRVIEEELPPLRDFVGPQLLRDHYQGMTAEQVRTLSRSPLFQIGTHTVDHPSLVKCSPEESLRQLRENKEWIERITGRACVSVAYPLGDFDERTVSQCKELGLTVGFAVEPLLRSSPEFNLERLGIYFASLPKLAIKARWGSRIRKLGLSIG